ALPPSALPTLVIPPPFPKLYITPTCPAARPWASPATVNGAWRRRSWVTGNCHQALTPGVERELGGHGMGQKLSKSQASILQQLPARGASRQLPFRPCPAQTAHSVLSSPPFKVNAAAIDCAQGQGVPRAYQSRSVPSVPS